MNRIALFIGIVLWLLTGCSTLSHSLERRHMPAVEETPHDTTNIVSVGLIATGGSVAGVGFFLDDIIEGRPTRETRTLQVTLLTVGLSLFVTGVAHFSF